MSARMLLRVAPLVAVGTLVTGCPDGSEARGPATPAAPMRDVVTKVLIVDDVPRTLTISAPRGKGPWPVVLVLHGGGMAGEGMRAYADLERRTTANAVFVYPDAIVRNVWADEYALHWDGTNDLGFMDAIVRSLVENGQADPGHVFALGLSSGAYFANQLACAWGKRLTAFAAVEGGGPYGDCSGAVSALIVHDPADPVVPASEGQESLARWQKEDTCEPTERAWNGACKLHACAGGTRVATCSPRAGVHGLGPGVRETALRFFGL